MLAAGTPAISITAHPENREVTEGSITGSLSVTAAGINGAEVTGYQWYSNTSASNVGGALIDGAVSASFAIPTTLTPDTYYYFCEITASGGAASVRSSAAKVTVLSAGTPVISITAHPADKSVQKGNISQSLSVLATVTEGAVLGYQWYSNTTQSNEGGTIVPDATAASFAIPTDLTEGAYYYFCEITASGGAASVRSNAAKVMVVLDVIPEGNTLAEKLQWIADNVESDTEYLVEVTADEAIAPTNLEYPGKTGVAITLTGIGEERTISLSEQGSMFNVGSGVTLTLENNITLKGRTDNTASLVQVNNDGTLVLNDGAKITGNTYAAPYPNGGGVLIYGRFTMNGGEISGNTAFSSSFMNADGGGVYIGAGIFTMNGGKISGNTVLPGNSYAGSGGGVYFYRGTFTMSGGEISGNIASGGGGVYVYAGNGTFTMDGGEISGNTANHSLGGGVYVYGLEEGVCGTFTMNGGKISGNTAATYGGGMALRDYSTFTMNGGEISGNTAATYGGGMMLTENGIFTKTAGIIYGNDVGTTLANNATAGQGHAVYWRDTTPLLYRDSTLDDENGDISTADPSTNWETSSP